MLHPCSREPNEYVNSSISKESPFSLAFICGTVLLKQIHRVRYDARRITIKCVRSFFICISVSSTLFRFPLSALSLSNFANRYMIRAYHVSNESLGYSSLCIRATVVFSQRRGIRLYERQKQIHKRRKRDKQ